MTTPISQPTIFVRITERAAQAWNETLKPLIQRVIGAVSSFFERIKQSFRSLYETKPATPPQAPVVDLRVSPDPTSAVFVATPQATPRVEAAPQPQRRGWWW